MTRGERNPLGHLRGVAGVQSVTYGEKGTLVGFADGTFLRVRASEVVELRMDLARTRRRAQVLVALLQNRGFHA